MFKIFKDAFKILNDNIILATPLLLFLLVISVYAFVGQYTINACPLYLWIFTTFFMMIIMLSLFYAGWFYMVKTAVNNFRDGINYEKGSFGLLKFFPIGIGDYFFSFLGATLIFFVILGFIILISHLIGIHVIGIVGIRPESFLKATQSLAAMKALIETMSPMQIVKLNSWYLLISGSLSIFFLLMMLWPAEILSGVKNPLKAFFKSIVNLSKNPKTLLLFVYISFINFLLSLLNGISLNNPFTFFIMTIVYCYFFVYLFVLIFLYYEEEIKSDSRSRSDSVG